jgi:hypothetical protein
MNKRVMQFSVIAFCTVGVAWSLMAQMPWGTVLDMQATSGYVNGSGVAAGAITSDASDPADSGDYRLGNAEQICWEASPAGTDVCVSATSAEALAFANGTGTLVLTTDASNNLVLTTSVLTGSGGVIAYSGANPVSAFDGSNFSLNSSMTMRWFSANPISAGSYDLKISRAATGKLKIDDGTDAVVLDASTDDTLNCQDSAGSVGCKMIAGRYSNTSITTIAADDTTPDVSANNLFVTSANTGATAITDLDNPVAGQQVTICGGSDTNSSTIGDSGNFNLTGAFTASADDCITLLVQADNDYVELYRVNN